MTPTVWPKRTDEEFTAVLLCFMNKHNLNQISLARALGIGRHAVYHWFRAYNGRTNTISQRTYVKLLKFAQCLEEDTESGSESERIAAFSKKIEKRYGVTPDPRKLTVEECIARLRELGVRSISFTW